MKQARLTHAQVANEEKLDKEVVLWSRDHGGYATKRRKEDDRSTAGRYRTSRAWASRPRGHRFRGRRICGEMQLRRFRRGVKSWLWVTELARCLEYDEVSLQLL